MSRIQAEFDEMLGVFEQDELDRAAKERMCPSLLQNPYDDPDLTLCVEEFRKMVDTGQALATGKRPKGKKR